MVLPLLLQASIDPEYQLRACTSTSLSARALCLIGSLGQIRPRLHYPTISSHILSLHVSHYSGWKGCCIGNCVFHFLDGDISRAPTSPDYHFNPTKPLFHCLSNQVVRTNRAKGFAPLSPVWCLHFSVIPTTVSPYACCQALRHEM